MKAVPEWAPDLPAGSAVSVVGPRPGGTGGARARWRPAGALHILGAEGEAPERGRSMRGLAAALALALAGCASGAAVYLPNEPGSTLVDLRGQSEREAWAAAHPEEPEAIREAILAGIFLEGMAFRHVETLSNPRRAGISGGGFWRRFPTTGEMRYRWYVGGEREPFDDGRGRLVCELVFVEDALSAVRFCAPAPAARDPVGAGGEREEGDGPGMGPS